MLKEKLKMMNGVLENGNYQLGQFKFIKLRKWNLDSVKMTYEKTEQKKKAQMNLENCRSFGLW